MMKLKFIPVVLMLLLGFNACDTYEESDSVANMRNGRAEFFKSEAALNQALATVEAANAAYKLAETAVINFEAALKETEVKAAQLANAKQEGLDVLAIAKAKAEHDLAMLRLKNDEVVLANALLSLETQKIGFEQQKIQAEFDFTKLANKLVGDKNVVLNEAFGVYTAAYAEWSAKTDELLTSNRNLIASKFALAGLKYDFDNMDVKGKQEAKIALLKTENTKLVASLKVVSDLKETNDWDAFIVTRDAMVAAKLVATTIQTNETNTDVVAAKAAKTAADDAKDVADQAATDAATAVTDANTAKTDAYIEIMTWQGDNALANINVDLGIYESVAAMQAGLASAKAKTLLAKTNMDNKQAQIDAPGVTADNKAIYEEELVALTATYEAKKAISDAYEVDFKAEVKELNDTYLAALAAAKTAADKADEAATAVDEAATAVDEADEAATAATTAEAEAIGVMTTEIARLNALVFIYKTSTENTTSAILTAMIDNIDDAIEALESDIEDNKDDIYKAEKTLAEIEAGNYTQATLVTTEELVIAKAESAIEVLKVKVAQAKANLDNRQAEYKALLED